MINSNFIRFIRLDWIGVWVGFFYFLWGGSHFSPFYYNNTYTWRITNTNYLFYMAGYLLRPTDHHPPDPAAKYLDCKVYNLHTTDQGKSSQEPKCASNSWQFCLKIRLFIFSDLVKGRSFKMYPHQVEFDFWLVTFDVKVFY